MIYNLSTHNKKRMISKKQESYTRIPAMNQLRSDVHEPIDSFDVVISGGGPVALASALEAIKLGKRVAIISDRDIDLSTSSPEDQKTVFSRGQRIFLDEQS